MTKSLQNDFWERYQFQEPDIENLFNHLIEVEEPLTPKELLQFLVPRIIDDEKKKIAKQQQSAGTLYVPQNHYKIGETVVFPVLDWDNGKVVDIRQGSNPDISDFEVIDVEFSGGTRRQFAAGLEKHVLNNAPQSTIDDPALNFDSVIQTHGKALVVKLKKALEQNEDLVRITGRWFPRSLLVDVNIGYLNLAEALLDMSDGGPLSVSEILEQIDLPTDVNPKLTEFSLNLALQHDERFDEVGPAGEVIWFLNRLEPEQVNNTPRYIKFMGEKNTHPQSGELLVSFDQHIVDELEECPPEKNADDKEIAVSLIYPHWRSGTLPLCENLLDIFPTAIEAPRVLFKFVDVDTHQSFNGWVIREHNYIYGLQEWYEANNLFPGCLIYIQKGAQPGEVNLRLDRRKPGREWIRTAAVNSNGTVSFSMLKQMVNTSYDERMAIYIPDVSTVDKLWDNKSNSKNYEKAVLSSMLELSKLNPQGHVHAQELYAAVNIIKRCPPGLIVSTLLDTPQISYLGNLYFRMKENEAGVDFNE